MEAIVTGVAPAVGLVRRLRPGTDVVMRGQARFVAQGAPLVTAHAAIVPVSKPS